MPYINIYIHPRRDLMSDYLLLHLARQEGIVLYCSSSQKFKQSRELCDFGMAATAAKKYAQTFLQLADRLADFAGQRIDHARESAFAMAQAAVYHFRTLFCVYHGFEAESCDVRILHQRMRTLSGLLPLLFEPKESRAMQALHNLNINLNTAQYDPVFAVRPEVLVRHLERVRRLGQIVTGLCKERIEFYDTRATL